MIKIVDFTEKHIDKALVIAKANYENERKCVNILPAIDEMPDFSPFVKNGLGVTAFYGNKMAGYLCCFDPCKNAFGTTNDTGIWSPVYANGIALCNDKNIFDRMYQEAAGKWVSQGITNHAITFYAHNCFLQNRLFRYGFGLRCIDAIRLMKKIEIKKVSVITYTELEKTEFQLIYPLYILLRNHLGDSPIFLRYNKNEKDKNGSDADKFAKLQIRQKARYFIAKDRNKIIAYIKISDNEENFISEVNCMKNICGAYCLTEYRGKGIFQNLLNYLINVLQNENNLLLGVDFESFNPTASGFWLKYFTEYTHSAVRRIDDRFVKRN